MIQSVEVMMELKDLLAPWDRNIKPGCVVSSLQNDSRLVEPGCLFLAYPGANFDGRQFLNEACLAGALAIAYEAKALPRCHLPTSIPLIAIADLNRQLAHIASRFYGNPTKKLLIQGVTGTNGKTTIAYQLAQAHAILGEKSAYIGTIGQGEVDCLAPLPNTTPDALCLQKLLHTYQGSGISQVTMEVSSHALAQHRVDCIDFTQAIFTNLTVDHLDYHGTMEAYGAAKTRLFTNDALEWAILNADDAFSKIIMQKIKPSVKQLTFGLHTDSDVRARSWQMQDGGTYVKLHSPWGQHSVFLNSVGEFNISNGLAVFASLIADGYAIDAVIDCMKNLRAAPGRMEIVTQFPCAIVDYAHTPDALLNALTTLAKIKRGRLWVVFGCGGDRDKTKRALMGEVASRIADEIILTSDNPRTEDPLLILEDIRQGIKGKNYIAIENRKDAINYALAHAKKDDIVLIAGKGHETYQEIGKIRHAFSDQAIVREYRFP